MLKSKLEELQKEADLIIKNYPHFLGADSLIEKLLKLLENESGEREHCFQLLTELREQSNDTLRSQYDQKVLQYETMKKALQEYGRHKPNCITVTFDPKDRAYGIDFSIPPCDCGLENFLKSDG